MVNTTTGIIIDLRVILVFSELHRAQTRNDISRLRHPPTMVWLLAGTETEWIIGKRKKRWD